MKKVKEYFQGVWGELKKVTWPTGKEVFNHTIIVIISSVVVMLIVAALDFGLSVAVEYIISLN